MKYYAIYEESTGRVMNINQCSDFMSYGHESIGNGLAIIPVSSANKNIYIDNGVIKDKSPSPHLIDKTDIIADGDDSITIANLHNPTRVTWPDGVTTEETDGYISFTMDEAGDFTVQLDAAPYIREVINVSSINPN